MTLALAGCEVRRIDGILVFQRDGVVRKEMTPVNNVLDVKVKQGQICLINGESGDKELGYWRVICPNVANGWVIKDDGLDARIDHYS